MSEFKPYSLNIKGRIAEFNRPAVMGIINVTPDSFFSESRVDTEAAVARAIDMTAAGARILDIGGCSTRPGFTPPSPSEEADRVVPAIRAIRQAIPDAIISVDTYRAAVAAEAVEAGADIINDVSGLDATPYADPLMLPTVARLNVPYILTASDTLDGVAPDNVAAQVAKDLQRRLRRLTLAGVSDIIIDPGFGFGKTVEQNFALLRDLPLLHALDCPILVGISRKSMITKSLHITADQALNSTTVLNTISLLAGAAILRVHDVVPAVETVNLTSSTLNPQTPNIK